MQFDEVSYENEDFSGVIMEMEDISKKKFTGCNFRRADFSDVSVIYGCTFDTCDFAGARLNGADIRHSAFLSCQFKSASFFGTRLESCKMTGSDLTNTECALLQIEGGDWSYTNLRKLSFQKQNLCGIRFFGADLSGCCFNQCKMNGCEFDEAIVHDTSFYKSDIRGATFERVNLFEVSFRQAKLDIGQCVTIAEHLTEGKYSPEEKEQ